VTELVIHGVNGLLIPSGDSNAFCAALERLLADPGLREQLGEAGRRTIENRFSLSHAAAQYAEIYHSLLDP
jgi:glycosyltransferase involved in cell wall biosynthesis